MSTTPTPATPAPAPDAETSRRLIVEALDDMYAAWIDRDWDRFNTHLSPDVTAWESHLPAMIRGLDELAEYRANRPAPTVMARFGAHVQDVDVWGGTAVVRYLLVGDPVDPADARREARVTEVFRWNGSAWLIVRRHAEAR